MFFHRLYALSLLVAVNALPNSGQDSPVVIHYNVNTDMYDVKLSARSTDIACRWGLWPKWTKTFTDAHQPIPAFSVAPNDQGKYNMAGKLIFNCVDERLSTGQLPEQELRIRGIFSLPCGANDVVQRFPLVNIFDDGDSGWNNLNFHRQYCAKILQNHGLMAVPRGAGQCWFLSMHDEPNQVLTVDVTSRTSTFDSHAQLFQNYISVTKTKDVNTVPPLEIRVYTSSYSVKVESSRVYHVCVYNYLHEGDPVNQRPQQQDLTAHIVTSLDQLQ